MTYPPDPYGGQPDWQGQQPGWPGQQSGWPAGPPPDNYLVWAILTTIFCCLPAGIVSIVYSTKVSALWMEGRHAEAQTAANNAKKWAIISAIVGAVVTVLIFVIWIVMIVIVGTHGGFTPSTPTTHYYRRY